MNVRRTEWRGAAWLAPNSLAPNSLESDGWRGGQETEVARRGRDHGARFGSRFVWLVGLVFFCVGLGMVGDILGGAGGVARAQTSASGPAAAPPDAHEATAMGLLLQSMFSPDRAPPHKTMGLAQRSFLDLVESSGGKLQIALVVDGTESMGDNLAAAKSTIVQMTEDLARYRGAHVGYQLVVYRDTGLGADGQVLFPLNRSEHSFTSDRNELQRGLAGVEAASGAPYFPEAIDLGVHAALTELAWDSGEDTTRWILLFGDAPPFASGFSEEKTQARRHFATDQLVALANRHGVLVNCVLCTSRPREQAVYEEVLGQTREFMNALATETGGLMVDLSYRDIQKVLADAARQHIMDYQEIPLIEQQDVERVLQADRAREAPVSDERRTKIAVLPHLPIAEMSFDPQRDEVRVAAELRQKFRNVPGTDVKSSSTVMKMFQLLQSRRLSDRQLLQTLAHGLSVDYVIWGEMTELNAQQGTVEFSSAIYSRESGEPVVRSVVRSNTRAEPADNLSGELAISLISRASENVADAGLADRFRLVNADPVRDSVVRPVSTAPQTRDQVLTALETLEQAAGYLAEEPAGQALLRQAEEALSRALDPAAGDPRNPFAHLLRANILFSQAQALALSGNRDAAREKTRGMVVELDLAHRDKSRADELLRTEIEGDYALFRAQDFPLAMQRYQTLTGVSAESAPRLHLARRAHWMLAGIYGGDWGVPQELVDPSKAREHLIQILAHWPESPEAGLIRRSLRWDEKQQKTQYPQLPHRGAAVTELIES